MGHGSDFVTYALTTDTWYHVVLEWPSNNSAQIYVNGVFVAQTSGFGLNDITNENIGSFNNGGDSHWQGLVDEVRLYDRALSAKEIAHLYRLGSPKHRML